MLVCISFPRKSPFSAVLPFFSLFLFTRKQIRIQEVESRSYSAVLDKKQKHISPRKMFSVPIRETENKQRMKSSVLIFPGEQNRHGNKMCRAQACTECMSKVGPAIQLSKSIMGSACIYHYLKNATMENLNPSIDALQLVGQDELQQKWSSIHNLCERAECQVTRIVLCGLILGRTLYLARPIKSTVQITRQFTAHVLNDDLIHYGPIWCKFQMIWELELYKDLSFFILSVTIKFH